MRESDLVDFKITMTQSSFKKCRRKSYIDQIIKSQLSQISNKRKVKLKQKKYIKNNSNLQ